MADITLPYAPADGATFTPGPWNLDVESTTAAASLIGELDGRLSDANFAGAARIRPEHPKPYETFRRAEGHLTCTLDYFEDAFTQYNSQTEEPPSGSDPFITVAGASSRVFLPYDCTSVVYTASMFYTVFQMRSRAQNLETETRTGPVSQYAVYIDGVKVAYSQRRTPRTYFPWELTAPAGHSPSPYENEDLLTAQFNLSHHAIKAGSDPDRCLAGWHQIDLRLYVPPNNGYEYFMPPFHKPGELTTDNTEYPIKHRFRCGIRGAKVLGFK
jgi:hypothetical protein